MPSWVEAQKAFKAFPKSPNGSPDFDEFRRVRYRRLEKYTQRPLIVYSTDFLNRPKLQACNEDIAIDLSDRDGVLEVTRALNSDKVDFIICSLGGMPEAADSIVTILRRKFKHIRVIVPSVAKSAAAMIALSGNELVMDADAELGPIDPQFVLRNSHAPAPAQAIIDQFEKAQEVVGKDPARLGAWLPILQQYGPALYQQALNAIEMSKNYVRDYLKTGIFAGEADGAKLSDDVVQYLGDHNKFKTHGARIGVPELRAVGLPVTVLNDDKEFHDLVQEISYGIAFTFQGTGCYRLWENSHGEGIFRLVQQQEIRIPMPPPHLLPGKK